MEEYDFVVIGGGIAGVSCAELLGTESHLKTLLVSASRLVKCAANVRYIGKSMQSFDVHEAQSSSVFGSMPNVTCKYAVVQSIDYENKIVHFDDGARVKFERICIATGAVPNIILNSDYVLGVRDTDSVATLSSRLSKCRRVLIIGNGGIATELVHLLHKIEIIWAIRQESVCATFVDAGAAQFMLKCRAASDKLLKRHKYVVEDEAPGNASTSKSVSGSALGPDWSEDRRIEGVLDKDSDVHIVKSCQLHRLFEAEEFNQFSVAQTKLPKQFSCHNEDWPVYAKLTNGNIFGVDLVISATGVNPSNSLCPSSLLRIAEDGGVVVDSEMRTSIEGVYAAGDICHAGWTHAPHWTQMRLWTQARQMGMYAAQCLLAHAQHRSMQLDFCFELFTHVTKFFGFKVVLLGKFAVEKEKDKDITTLVRVDTESGEYARVVVKEGSVQGAVLVGETQLEETLENLILNGTDISHIQDQLLDPNIDIEDYFD